MSPSSGNHWQWDSRRSRLAAWIGWDPSLVFGAKIVVTRSESETSFGGRYASVWLGPVYIGAGWVW